MRYVEKKERAALATMRNLVDETGENTLSVNKVKDGWVIWCDSLGRYLTTFEALGIFQED